MEQIEIQYAEIVEDKGEIKENKELDSMLEKLANHLNKKPLKKKNEEEVKDAENSDLNFIPPNTKPLLRNLNDMIDHEDNLNMIDLPLKSPFCKCEDLSIPLEEVKFFLTVKLLDYKPLELLYFNLTRALQISELKTNPKEWLEIEEFVAEFSKVYKKKTNLYAHLATDATILKACVNHIDFSHCSRQMKLPIPTQHHYCDLPAIKFLREMQSLKLKYLDNVNIQKEFERTPNFLIGINEEYFAFCQNIEFDEHYRFLMSYFSESLDIILRLSRDFDVVANIYEKMRLIFKEDLTKNFPLLKCKALMKKMQNYDSEPRSFYKIGIIGNYGPNTENLLSWFFNKTQIKIQRNCVILGFEKNGKLIEMGIYLLSSNNFRICHFDIIIYCDHIFHPAMNTYLKHFATSSVYCQNKPSSAFDNHILFTSFDTQNVDIFRELNLLTRRVFSQFHKYRY